MSAPRIGLLLSTRLAGTGVSDDPLPFLALAERAEAAGLDEVWVGDSLVARPRPEPLTLLAAVAARTRRVTIGTAVLLPALRHPLLVAHAAATLDRIAGGRLVLGVGTGFAYPGTAHELASVGVAMTERTARVVESIEVWRRLWSATGATSHCGRFWKFRDVVIVPRPLRPTGPPIWLGGNTPEAARRAAQLADGFFPTSASPERFAEARERVHAEAVVRGRDPGEIDGAVVLTLCLGVDRETAQTELRSYMETYYAAPLEVLSSFIGVHAGTAEDAAEWILRYVRAGARHVVLRLASADQEAQLERTHADLLPLLRGAG